MKSISESTVIICSIVRNAEKGLKRNIPVIDELCQQFKDFRIIVYENDSTDSSKQLLKAWNKKDTVRIHVSLNNTDPSQTIPSVQSVPGISPFFCHKRIDKMARLRNMYMEYIDEQGWEADYLVVVDMDVAQLYLENILTSFTLDKEWDAVTSFGYSISPKMFIRRYHDSYALTVWEDKEISQTEDMIVENAYKFGKLKSDDEWIRVASAFGGLAIYRFETIKGLRYTVPALENGDSRVEVKCEHFSLYKQMIERGYDKIYINPAMKLKYAELTLKTFWNSLHQSTFLDYYKRKLGLKK